MRHLPTLILIACMVQAMGQRKPAYQKCSSGKKVDSIAFAKKIDYYVYLLEHNKSLKYTYKRTP